MGGFFEFFLIFMFPVFLEAFLYLQIALGMADAPAVDTKPMTVASVLPEHGFGFATVSRDATFAAAWQAQLAKLPEADRKTLKTHLSRYNMLSAVGFKTVELPKLAAQITHLHVCMDDMTRRMPSMSLLIETRSAEAAASIATKPEQYVELRRPAQTRVVDGLSVTQIRLPEAGRMYLASHGHTVVVSLAPELVAKYVALLKSPPERSLAGTERYKKSLFAKGESPSTGVYVDVDNVIASAQRMMSRRDAMEFDQVDSILGFTDIHTLQAALRLDEKGATFDIEMNHDADSRPLLTLFPTGAAADASMTRLLDPDSAVVAQLQLADTASLLKVRDFILSREKDLDTNDITRGIEEVERFFGDKIPTVVKELRGQALIAMGKLDFAKMFGPDERGQDYPGPPITFVVPFKDAKAGAARMRKIVDFIGRETGPKGKVEEKTHKDVAYLEFARRPRGAAVMLGNNMVIVMGADRIKPIIERHVAGKAGLESGPLVATRAAASTLRLGYSVSGLFSFGGLFAMGRSVSMDGPMVIRPGGGGDAKPFKPKRARPLAPKAPAAGGMHSTVQLFREPGKLRFRTTHTGTAYVARALELTRLAAYVERMNAMSQFDRFYLAVQKYQHVKKSWPKSWQEIMTARRDLGYVYLPMSGRDHVLNPKPDEKVEAKDRALVYTRDGTQLGGRIVLFADGSVRWVSTTDFAKVAQTNGLSVTDPVDPRYPKRR